MREEREGGREEKREKELIEGGSSLAGEWTLTMKVLVCYVNKFKLYLGCRGKGLKDYKQKNDNHFCCHLFQDTSHYLFS